jgi:hypothetical protein
MTSFSNSNIKNTLVTALRECGEEMGPKFKSGLRDISIIGSWGGTTIITGIISKSSRKDFKPNRETSGVVLIPLEQSFNDNTLKLLNKNGTGFNTLSKGLFSSFVTSRLTDNFAKGLIQYLNHEKGKKPYFGRGVTPFKSNGGAVMLLLIKYNDKVNNRKIPCLYMVVERNHYKFGNSINFCAGKWDICDGLSSKKDIINTVSYINNPINSIIIHQWKCTITKKGIVIWKKGNQSSYKNPFCGVTGCHSCNKPGQVHRCCHCGSKNHRAKTHFTKNGFMLQKGNCGVHGCIICRLNQQHRCVICNATTHRACVHYK